MSKKPGARFNAYDNLFSIRKQPNESLQSLCARIDTSMQTIQDLHPTTFTLKEMDELHSMALIRSLPDEYKSLSQSLMLLDELNKNKIREAFLAEETSSQRRGEQIIAGTSDLALSSANSLKQELECDFRGWKGHTSADCRKLVTAHLHA